jgi:hypothetical protein
MLDHSRLNDNLFSGRLSFKPDWSGSLFAPRQAPLPIGLLSSFSLLDAKAWAGLNPFQILFGCLSLALE